MKNVYVLTIVFAMIVAMTQTASTTAYAYDQKAIELAGGLEETLGHLWALERNLDDGNYELVMTHALHPVSELYDSMKPALMAASPEVDMQIRQTVQGLADHTSEDVPLADAKQAVSDARDTVNDAYDTVIGDIRNEPNFKLTQMKMLLETSIVEYAEAVEDGKVTAKAELQDGAAFVTRANQLFDELDGQIDHNVHDSLDASFESLHTAYAQLKDPFEIESITLDMISTIAYAYDQKAIELAGGLEETLGHLWALERNLDDGNYELVMTHALHPVSELYDSMKPALMAASPEVDMQIRQTVQGLADHTSEDVPLADAKQAISDARDTVNDAYDTVIGDIRNEPNFKMLQMKMLLETSIVEYAEAVTDGQITAKAELQDGAAFVTRANTLFDELQGELDANTYTSLDAAFDSLHTAYAQLDDPSEIESITMGIITTLDDAMGIMETTALGESNHIDAIRTLLAQAKSEYTQGNTDLALSYATKAYLDHYEFIEGSLVEQGRKDLMLHIENLMREELRNMIRSDASVSDVTEKIDEILDQVDLIDGDVTPEEPQEMDLIDGDVTPEESVIDEPQEMDLIGEPQEMDLIDDKAPEKDASVTIAIVVSVAVAVAVILVVWVKRRNAGTTTTSNVSSSDD